MAFVNSVCAFRLLVVGVTCLCWQSPGLKGRRIWSWRRMTSQKTTLKSPVLNYWGTP